MPQVWRQSPSAVGEYVLFTDVAQVLTKKSRNCASSAQGSAPNVLIDAISLLLGLAGIIAGRVAVTRWAAQKWLRDPHAYWFTGLITLAPAWLIAFVTLLPTSPGARPQLTSGGLWILSASAALIGTITCPSPKPHPTQLTTADALATGQGTLGDCRQEGRPAGRSGHH